MLGENIRKLRKEKGLTLKQLGNELGGLAENTIGMYESNRRKPDNDILEKLSRYFQVPIPYLLGQGIYVKKDFIIKNMDTIIKIIESDGGHAIVEILNGHDSEMQFKVLTGFLLDVTYDEEAKNIQLTYYI